MGNRKGWDALKADYRQRLESKGITRERYDRGESLKAGRGHEHTPESPKRIPKERIVDRDFGDYMRRREDLIQQVIEHKRELFGDTPRSERHGERWSEERSEENIRKYGPSMKDLKWAATATKDEIIDAIRGDPDRFAFLMYH